MTILAEIALVLLAAIGVAVCLARLPAPGRPTTGRASARQAPRPAQLVRLEGVVSMSGASALHAHAELRPLLAEVVSRRLAARGQALERMPDAAGRELLGERLWEIVRPDRPFPEDRHGPGVSARDLCAMLELIERL